MKDKPENIISDEDIERVHANAQYGDTPKRDVVNYGLLKIACGFGNGYTTDTILEEHGLISGRHGKMTLKGRNYLWSVFGRTCF